MGRGQGSDDSGLTDAGREKVVVFSVVEQFEQLGRELFSDGTWTCDGGALLLSEMLARARIDYLIRIGLYHYSEEKLPYRYRQLFQVPSDYRPSEAELAEEFSAEETEHHHWIEIPRLDLLIDPNGEVRGEPRIQPLAAAKAYEVREDRDTLQYSPIYDYERGEVMYAAEFADENDEVRSALAKLDQLS